MTGINFTNLRIIPHIRNDARAFYLGRVVGHAITIGSGIIQGAMGLLVATASITLGGGATLMSGGTLAIAGAKVSVAGVAAGAAIAVNGVVVAVDAVAALQHDWDMFMFANDGGSISMRNGNRRNPLENIRYTPKVQDQMANPPDRYHAFPKVVDNYGAHGRVTRITGADGIVRTRVHISGSLHGRAGVFEYIIEPDGITVNHRLFIPNR